MNADNPVTGIRLPDGKILPAKTEAQYLRALDHCLNLGIRVVPAGTVTTRPAAVIVRQYPDTY